MRKMVWFHWVSNVFVVLVGCWLQPRLVSTAGLRRHTASACLRMSFLEQCTSTKDRWADLVTAGGWGSHSKQTNHQLNSKQTTKNNEKGWNLLKCSLFWAIWGCEDLALSSSCLCDYAFKPYPWAQSFQPTSPLFCLEPRMVPVGLQVKSPSSGAVAQLRAARSLLAIPVQVN